MGVNAHSLSHMTKLDRFTVEDHVSEGQRQHAGIHAHCNNHQNKKNYVLGAPPVIIIRSIGSLLSEDFIGKCVE